MLGNVSVSGAVTYAFTSNAPITLAQDQDTQHIDWTMGGTSGQLPITAATGLTINGDGANDLITLNTTHGSPFPSFLHLNGTFTISGLPAGNPLANTILDIGRSTVYFAYTPADPLLLIMGYLKNGYNGGHWNGATSTGAITSIPAAQNGAQTTAIGYADSSDGLIAGQPANTVELRYTLYGDTKLTSSVGFNDFTRMTQHWNQTSGGTWDTGDFNYDGSVNSADFTLMTRTYNTRLGSQAQPAISPLATPTVSVAQAPPPTDSDKNPSGNLAPVIQVKPTTTVVHLVTPTRQQRKHRT